MPVTDHGFQQPDRTFGVVLGQPTHAALGRESDGTATILGNPAPVPTVQLATDGTAVAETTASVTLTVTLSSPNSTGGVLSVPYHLTDITAVGGANYDASSGTAHFAAGAVTTTISIPISDDSSAGPDTTFQLTLDPAGDAVQAGAVTSAVVTIINIDGFTPPPAAPVHRPIAYTEYDNLNEVVSQEQYDGDGATIADADVDGVPDRPASGLLRAESTTEYDRQGRAFRTHTWSVNPATGAVSASSLTTDSYFDHRGDLVATSQPGGTWSKASYDGTGRGTFAFTTDGGGGTTWSAACSVADDVVLEQTESTYDQDGNVILTADRQRFDDATGAGSLGTPTSGISARVYYMAYYYDAADRPIATVNLGTNPDALDTHPASVPSRSDTVLVNSTTYNSAGWASSTFDPRDIENRTTYDNLGRATQTIENYMDGSPSDEDDKTTNFTYDGDGHMLTYELLLPGPGHQTTQYVYGVGTSTIHSNDLLAAVYHPDLTSGAASSSQADTYLYDALGDATGFTDRNGTSHAYSFDVLGRPTADAATIPSGNTVDTAVVKLATAYDTQGNAYLFSSYNSSNAVVNQVLRQFNGLGQLTAEYQEHAGAVATSTSDAVHYAYSAMSGGANNSRPTSMTYAGGYVLGYSYGTSGGLNDTISRLSAMTDPAGTVEAYKYLGLGTVVERDHPIPGLNQTFIATVPGDGGDKYAGLDRFGRVAEQKWLLGTTTVEDLVYGYDRDSNALFRKNLVNTGFSELNTYDDLNQLTNFQRGTLNSTNTAITGTVARSQILTPDAAGNFTSVNSDGTTVSRTTNKQNEVTAVGSSSLAYDADGNATTDDQGHTLVFDPWNRLLKVKSGSAVIAGYAYDALSRRVSETHADTTSNLYVSAADQVLEEQDAGSTINWYVWSAGYVDALVVKEFMFEAIGEVGLGEAHGGGFSDSGFDTFGTLVTNREWAVQDANWNITAVVKDDDSGMSSPAVAERYIYDPYGQATFLTPSWGSPSSSSSISWQYLHQGLRLDSIVDLYDNRARAYSPTLMRFLQNDPIGFGAGDPNVYRYQFGSPATNIDPSGLETPTFSHGLHPGGPGYPGYEKPTTPLGPGNESKTFPLGNGFGGTVTISYYPADNQSSVADILRYTIDAAKKIRDTYDAVKNYWCAMKRVHILKSEPLVVAPASIKILFTDNNRQFYLQKLKAAYDQLNSGKLNIGINYWHSLPEILKPAGPAYTYVGGQQISITNYFWQKKYPSATARDDDRVDTMYHEIGRLQGITGDSGLSSTNNIYNWDAIIRTVSRRLDQYKAINDEQNAGSGRI